MAFLVEVTERAADDLRDLPRDVRHRIYRKLDQVAEAPGRYIVRLKGVDAFRVRVGDYRVFLDVDWDGEKLYVLAVLHRSRAYR